MIGREGNARSCRIVVDHDLQGGSGLCRTYESFAGDVLRANGFGRGQAMVARQHDDQRLLRQMLERQSWHLLSPEKGRVDLPAKERPREFRRFLTGKSDLDIGQLVTQDS